MTRVAFGQFSARRNSLATQHCSDCSKATPAPAFGYLKGQLIVDTALHTVRLLIMRIIPSENDGFVLITLDFPSLNKLFLLGADAFEKNRGGFIRRILRDEFSLNRLLEKGLL